MEKNLLIKFLIRFWFCHLASSSDDSVCWCLNAVVSFIGYDCTSSQIFILVLAFFENRTCPRKFACKNFTSRLNLCLNASCSTTFLFTSNRISSSTYKGEDMYFLLIFLNSFYVINMFFGLHVHYKSKLNQGRLLIWSEDFSTFFQNWKPSGILNHDTNVI